MQDVVHGYYPLSRKEFDARRVCLIPVSDTAASSPFVPSNWMQLMRTACVVSSEGRWNALAVYRFSYPCGDRLQLPPLQGHFVSAHMHGPCRLRGNWNGQLRKARSIPGDSIIVAAGQTVVWDWDGAFDEIQLVVDPQRLDRAAAEISDRPVTLREGISIRDPFIHALAVQVVEELSSQPRSPASLGDALADTLIWHLLRRHSTLRRADALERIDLPAHKLRRVLEFIASHATEDVSIDAIASAAGVSPSRLTRGFKKATGQSPYQYLLQRRVDMAQELLRRSDQTLAEIAVAVGFATQSQFTVAFRRRCRVTPGEYRKAWH